MISAGTRSVMRLINGADIKTSASFVDQSRRRVKHLKKRENRIQRKQQNESRTHPYIKFTCTTTTSNSNKESENCDVEQKPFSIHCQQKRFGSSCFENTELVSSTTLILCPELFCDTQQLSAYELSDYEQGSIKNLLLDEMTYHPNTNFLYNVDPVVDDKVDHILRNEAIFNLRFLHNGFFTLSPDTFCKAVNLMDRFIVKVKVKPKYTSCVATACYYIAAKLNEPNNTAPSAETLVQIARCGGTASDLYRMEDIIVSKLAGNVEGITALDFVRAFLVNNATGGQTISLSLGLTTRLQIALCSLDVYRYRPVCLALAVLLQEGGLKTNVPLSKLEAIAKYCEVEWSEVEDCADLVQELYEAYYRQPLPSSRDRLVWTLSRRTRLRMVSSSPTPLDTISEDVAESSDEEDLSLSALFEE